MLIDFVSQLYFALESTNLHTGFHIWYHRCSTNDQAFYAYHLVHIYAVISYTRLRNRIAIKSTCLWGSILSCLQICQAQMV